MGSPAVPNWDHELAALDAGWERVAGVDEAGRGPLAGPVVAAAVLLPPGQLLRGMNDSKKLEPAARDDLYARITAAAIGWGIGTAEPAEIDAVNILRATHRAMARALAALDPPAGGALVDGLPVPGLPCPHRALVKGDALSVSIAAASVLAKVTRDRRMMELELLYPGYGLAQHKGYPTPAHYAALRELGPSPCHRRSFRLER